MPLRSRTFENGFCPRPTADTLGIVQSLPGHAHKGDMMFPTMINLSFIWVEKRLGWQEGLILQHPSRFHRKRTKPDHPFKVWPRQHRLTIENVHKTYYVDQSSKFPGGPLSQACWYSSSSFGRSPQPSVKKARSMRPSAMAADSQSTGQTRPR